MIEPGPTPSAASSRASPRRDRDVPLSVFLLLLLATTALDGTLREAGAGPAMAVLRLLVLLAGVFAVGGDRAYAALAALAFVVAGVGHALGGDRSLVVLWARLAGLGVIGAALLRHVFRPGRVTVHRVLGAVAVYLLLAATWGAAYQLLVVLKPGAIQGAAGPATLDEAMWLSFVTVTTTGYGDVLPVSPTARSLAILEAMTGVLFPAILIARLVSLLQGPAAPSGE